MCHDLLRFSLRSGDLLLSLFLFNSIEPFQNRFDDDWKNPPKPSINLYDSINIQFPLSSFEDGAVAKYLRCVRSLRRRNPKKDSTARNPNVRYSEIGENPANHSHPVEILLERWLPDLPKTPKIAKF